MPPSRLAFGALWKPSTRPLHGHGGIIKDFEDGWRHTGTGGMVKIMLDAKVPVRWVPAPGMQYVDLVEMPHP